MTDSGPMKFIGKLELVLISQGCSFSLHGTPRHLRKIYFQKILYNFCIFTSHGILGSPHLKSTLVMHKCNNLFGEFIAAMCV